MRHCQRCLRLSVRDSKLRMCPNLSGLTGICLPHRLHFYVPDITTASFMTRTHSGHIKTRPSTRACSLTDDQGPLQWLDNIEDEYKSGFNMLVTISVIQPPHLFQDKQQEPATATIAKVCNWINICKEEELFLICFEFCINFTRTSLQFHFTKLLLNCVLCHPPRHVRGTWGH